MDTDQIIAMLAAQATPVKLARGPGALLGFWLAASGVYACVLMLFSGFRDDLALKMHSPLFTAEIGALLFMAVTSGVAASVLAFPDMYQRRKLAFTPVLPLVLFVIIVALEWAQDVPPAPRPVHGIECLSCILLYACVPAALMIFLLRKYAGTHYYTAGAVAALAGASIGCLALRLAEKTDSISHLVEWHYLPILGFAFLGVLLGRIFLKW